MSSLLIYYFLLIIVLPERIHSEVFTNRPKIKVVDGDLILQPAYDRSIYLNSNGPKSKIYYGELNLLSIYNRTNIGDPNKFIDNVNTDKSQLSDAFRRIQNLESLTSSFPSNLNLNILNLTRKVNTLSNRVRALQTLLSIKNTNECQSHPCENGGTCLDLVNGYHCLCPSTWKGANCDKDVNECRNFAGTDLGCQNGATCINRPGSYECICKPGWYGLDCTRTAKNCSGGDFEMCGHGICLPVNSGEGIKCICNQGWTTDGTSVACLTDVNECLSGQGSRCSVNPRVDCINLPGSFRCGECPRGYEGDGFACYDIDECLTIPNGGCSTTPMVTCHNTIGSRICGSCPPDYQGDGITCIWTGSCSINHGGCHPSAQCIENQGFRRTSQCLCPYGMEGDGIGIHGCYVSSGGNNTQRCENNPCGVHGHCHPLRQGFTCICYPGYSGAYCTDQNNFCSNNPCQNGGSCRLDDKLTRGFRCECTALYSGDVCQVHIQQCGGFLDSEEGSIIYPLTNTTYMHNSRCAWVIHTAPDKVINVTFSKFNLENDTNECRFDFLQIHDGRNSARQLIGRFCGSNLPNGGNIISSHNYLYFWFRSDHSVAKEGFALHWNSILPVCGGEVDATTHGHVSSPGSPNTYPPNRDCYWHLRTDFGKKIQLHFFQLDIEEHANCSFDYLAIYDGEHTTDPLISKYCNTTQPAPVQSSSSEILIHFHSDALGSGKGFQIAFAPIEGVPGCGGFFTSDRGEIVSPSYKGLYLSNLLCEYKIITRPDTKIRIEFKSFNLERSLICKYDFLKIYDGPTSDSPLVGKFCGITHPKTYTSTTNKLFILFRTDHTVASDGFKITFESICLQTIVGDSGVVKSPNYPMSYPKQTECEYVIGTAPSKKIQLTFQDFDIEDSRYYNCTYDYVEIRDGHFINSSLLGKYCGNSEAVPPMQISSYNYLYIKFKSDNSINGRGFYANYTTLDTECGGIYKEDSGLINHPADSSQVYRNNQNCTWYVIAPEGMHIKLTWNRFELELMRLCVSDYVEIIEIDDDNIHNTLGKYCGNSLPPALTISSNHLVVRFVSDNSIRENGFSLSYSFLDEHNHCGGLFVKSHGYIFSPNWPQVYEPNRDCTWIITVPVGRQIRLNITDFDIERPLRDKCDLGDYLEIRDGSTPDSSIIGKYCGYFKYKRVVSTANSLHLHFHSDFYLSGKGFRIEWDGTLSGCGGTLTSVSGSISSPNYPQEYHENAECFYRIVTSSGSKIRVSFTELDLEKTRDCTDDYVEIFDGRNEHSSSYGKHCFMSPKLNNIETSSNYAFIKFRSDILISGKGFVLNYNTVCNNNISGSYGVIESPGYPEKYPLNSNCLWTITVPKGNKINITFTHFNIFSTLRPYSLFYNRHPWTRQSSYFNSLQRHRYSYYRPLHNCEIDYLQIKETSDINFSEKQCGDSLPKAITSISNSLQIKFITGSYFPRQGFRLEWVNYGCGGSITKSEGSLVMDRIFDSGEIECEWVIETPIGTAVTINFTEFLMTESKNCSVDAIEIYNGQSIVFPLLTRFCVKGQITVEASSNILLVKLIKQSSLRDVYFKSTFTSHRQGCGGMIESQSGSIHSINYPKNYDNYIDCLWSIKVPRNHRIELNFMDLDLYEEDCGDLIKIYDGPNMLNNNYTWLICPNTNISQIISSNSSIVVQFKTDEYGTAKGFKANFSMICGAVIEANEDGIISNDKFSSYMNQNCTWTILAPEPTKKVKLTIQHLSLPRNTDIVTNRKCPSSYLRVYDGNDEKAPLVEEFCGRKAPPTIISHGSALTIQLGSYTNTIDGQFSAHYSTLINACGGVLISEEGTIASPSYPLSYPDNVNCEWILSTSPGNRVYITFERFDLYYSDGCNEDYLEVRENNGGGKLLAVYCGQDIPTNTTTGTKLYIKFHSNDRNTGQGFLLNYGFLHGNDIIGLQSGEITSPLYPLPYPGSGEYSWRIFIDDAKPIFINIDHLEIHKTQDTCNSKLLIFDGYDEDAPLLEELCGLLKHESKVIHTSSNVAYIKLVLDATNIGSMFHIKWAETNINFEVDNDSLIKCGTNKTELLSVGSEFVFSSPNYPNIYDPSLNCTWIFQAAPSHHVRLIFDDISIEETPTCFADYISIYSSNNLVTWTPLAETICLSEKEKVPFDSSIYMKVIFKSDSSISRKGFKARVIAACGGMLQDKSGVIELTKLDTLRSVNSIYSEFRCNWVVRVRPGRTIQIKFEYFNMTNNNDCTDYIILRNGESTESPYLGNGKYCGYSHENMSEIISSSNVISLSSIISDSMMPITELRKFPSFRLRYEEKNIECGVTSTLDFDHKWEIINSPNYPSVPIPYTECVWIFRGPPGEIIRIDFLDRFDLAPSDQCDSESVEIRDGSSLFSPLKARLCKERPRPSTFKSSGNAIFIKYSTQVSEPRDGFKANVSIDICGGTIMSESGELTSPGYPHMLVLPPGTVCQWEIISFPRHVINLHFTDIDLPDTKISCQTKVTIEETVPGNNSVAEAQLKLFCNDDYQDYTDTIETLTDRVIIKLHYGERSEWTHTSESKGFKLTFNSSRPFCGGTITAFEGYLTSPGYPRETSLRFCQWKIIVPNINRRIRLELIDFEEKQNFNAYNDFSFNSRIEKLDVNNSSQFVFQSSQNKLTFYVWALSRGKDTQRFKAKFSSDDAALCGGNLQGIQGELTSPNLQTSYFCEWQYTKVFDQIKAYDAYNTIYLTVNMSSLAKSSCRFLDSQLTIKSDIGIEGVPFSRSICTNSENSYRIPTSTMQLTALQIKDKPFTFDLRWKLQPCGGVIHTGQEAVNIVNVPNKHNTTIDCAWVLIAPVGFRVEFKLEGLFNLDCSDEFIQIKSGLGATSSFGKFCKSNIPEKPIVSSFMNPYIEYHSKPQNETNIKLLTKLVSYQCGGYLTKSDRIFTSPNYPGEYESNQECTWEIQAELGFRISLKFVDRFVIEEKINCTKDVIIVYDWKENKYQEMARLCGRHLPPSYNSTSTQMKVTFRTDADINLDGFKAQWDPICGGTLVAKTEEQYMYSPGYTNVYYPLLDCSYNIVAQPPNRIFVKFLDFELEGNYPECKYDNLTLTEHSEYKYFSGIYCGKEIPPPLQAFENVEIIFKTDRYTQKKGFKISYSLYSCGGQVKEPRLITSKMSGTAENYDENMNCTWFIEAPINKTVVIKFPYIDLESSYECYSDYVAVYEGAIIDTSKRLSLMCGHVNSTTVIKSNTNKAVLQFISDTGLNYKGFEAQIFFSYSALVGCGGDIDIKSTSSYNLRSPLIGGSVVYENYLDCHWKIKAPIDHVIKISFTKFHVASCAHVNQTAIGFSTCDCDLIELKDGLNPNSLVIGTYCGHNFPPEIFSSNNYMTIRFSTDGEAVSSGFEAVLTSHPSSCGQTVFSVSRTKQQLRSPGYEIGSIPRGLHCSYIFDSESEPYSIIHLRVNNMDLEAGTAGNNSCNKDRLIITSNSLERNTSLGQEFILNEADDFFSHAYFFDSTVRFPTHILLCGSRKSLDFYVSKSVMISLKTTPENTVNHRGVEIEVAYIGFCGRNYTELQGRIQTSYGLNEGDQDCYTLISVPANYTISVYFISVSPVYWNSKVYLEIFDGNNTNAPLLEKVANDYPDYFQTFSTGNSLLLHNRMNGMDMVTYDLNYIATNNGQGCGGTLQSEIGRVTSPLYPHVFRKKSTCEWELETPSNTRLYLKFPIFNLGTICGQNYLRLVDRNGNIISTYCSEAPADYTSDDNYVKIVFTTSNNNGGSGWVADFCGVF